MKNFRLTFGALACAAFLTLTGCQKDAVDPAMEDTTLAVDAKEFQITEIAPLASPVVIAATENTAFSTQSTQDAAHNLGFILSKLHLRENQRNAVKAFIAQHEQCVTAHREKIKQLHEELLKLANAKREELVQAYREGKITKPELEARLATLRTKLQEEIAKHQEKQLQLDVMRRCRTALFAKIESVLGPEQLALWTRWKQSL